MPASAQPFHLDVARYTFDEMPAHLLDNRTKPVKDTNERFGLNRKRLKEKRFHILRPNTKRTKTDKTLYRGIKKEGSRGNLTLFAVFAPSC
ncbi:hypothetical protein [Prevotella falsenii]|uniref:hypothetical protein n=1 Tax=Prevotella falsenii TaxID=515414 RepID=UPI0012EB3472|nr:hypothetical protein [Prevotella falsenii]